MTQQELVVKITEKVIAACPDIMTRNTSAMIPKPFSGLINYRDDSIGIAEILRTIQQSPKKSKLVMDDYGVFWDMHTLQNSTLRVKSFSWDLEHDNIENQSPETLEFLWELLK